MFDVVLDRINSILSSFAATRGNGNTTALINILKENKKAVLVTATHHHSVILKNNNPEIGNRIIDLSSLLKLRGSKDYFLVFDNSALQSMFCEMETKAQKVNTNVAKINTLIQELKNL